MLQCDFVYNDWDYSGIRYTCNAKNLDITDLNLRFLEMEGTHLFNKSNSDVLGIMFHRQSMTYLAQGASAFFSKLEDFSVTRSELLYINRSNFRNMKNLKAVSLCHNRIQRIPQESFIDLEMLEYLSLSSNEIKSLPTTIFRSLVNLKTLYLNDNRLREISHLLLSYSTKLENIWLQENKLIAISSNITEPLPALKHLLLRDNTCIDKDYNNITPETLKKVSDDITENCSSECESKMIEVAECTEKYFELEKENENLKKEVHKLRNYMRSYLIV